MKLTKTFIKKIISNTENELKKLKEADIVSIIQQANYQYYNTDEPLFSDEIYDKIHDYLEEINHDNPILKNVGSLLKNDAEKKVTLPYFMGSLDKIKADNKILEKFKNIYKDSYLISDKLDGNSCMIQFTKSKVQMFSRGNGIIGQDISHLIPFVKYIPELCICEENFTVRGELIISKENFKTLEGFSNGRNTVSGVINAKIPDLEIAKLIEFIAYELINPIMSPEDQIIELKNKNFKCVYNLILNENDLNTIKLSEILIDRKENSPYEVDGIVVSHNKIHNKSKDSNPKYAFAYKDIVSMTSAEVIVNSIEWNVSKDGYIKPTILFDSVNISGSIISRATGFNAKFIRDNNIGPGSKILIIKAGDVIPKVEKVLLPSSTGKPQMPNDIEYIWNDTNIDIMIKNKTEPNKEVELKNLEYFFKKIDVVGMGPGNIKKIYNTGYTTIGSIFNMKIEDFLKVETFKESMANKLFGALQEKRNNIDCITLMDSSNMIGRGFSSKKLELIINEYPNIISKNYIPSLQELITIKGIEKKTALLFIENLPKYFRFLKDNNLSCINTFNKEENKIIDKEENKIIIDKEENKKFDKGESSGITKNNFENEVVIFSGFRSKVFENYIKAQGGRVVTSVSSKTTLLIEKKAKDGEDSSKVEEAKKLNIKIMSLLEFEQKYHISAK